MGIRFTGGDQPVGRVGHCAGDGTAVATGIDDREPVGIRSRKREEACPDPAVEVEVELGLEAGHVTGRLARQPVLDGEVEEDREVRLEAIRGGLFEGVQPLERDPAARAGRMTSVTS